MVLWVDASMELRCPCIIEMCVLVLVDVLSNLQGERKVHLILMTPQSQRYYSLVMSEKLVNSVTQRHLNVTYP